VSNETLLVLLGSGVGAITPLDVGDRFVTRGERYDGERLRAGTFFFLLAMSVLFLAVQVGLSLLFPQIPAIAAWCQERLASWTGEATTAAPVMGWRLAVVVVATFYVGGLIDYLTHRFFNHSGTFWWTHEYHHLPNEVFVILPGLMIRPFAAFSSVMVALATVSFGYLLVWACGWPVSDLLPAFKLLVVIQLMLLMTSHSAFLRRFWAAHYLMRCLFLTTPQEHLIHHTTDRPGNYGNTTTLWDRLFGTYQDPTLPENQGRPIGLDYDQDFLGVLTFGKVKLPASWRERFQLHRYCNLDGQSQRVPT
jgi:sterol desaturase/sphingolipid hydroxylase (fatty acid hydroxylase superfamily)